jgi:uncharacterized membrane protein YccF (DUF307 family)
MRFIGNVIWLAVAGLWLAIGYLIAGIINCIFIITIPFGIASFRLAGYALWPFGRTVVKKPTAGAMSAIGNVIWFVVSGLWLAIGHVIAGAILCVFIITIPLGIASFKMAALALFPLGKDIVPARFANTLPPAATVVTAP